MKRYRLLLRLASVMHPQTYPQAMVWSNRRIRQLLRYYENQRKKLPPISD